MRPGGEVAVQYKKDKETIISAVIVIRKHHSLSDLTSNEDFLKTGGLYRDQKDQMNAIESYYPFEEQRAWGFIAN